jgi:peptide/nickel transport system substrate-binding protein
MRQSHHSQILSMTSILGAVILVAVACSTSSNPSTSTKTLTIAIPGDIETLDPCCSNFIRANTAIAQVYDTPVSLKPVKSAAGAMIGQPSEIQGIVYESWTRQPDNVTWIIKIRKGLAFHDGTPITAKEVAYTYERSLATNGGENWLQRNIAFVTKPPVVLDDYTIKLVGDQPSPMAISVLYMDGAGIVQPSVIKSHSTADDPWATKWMARNVAGGSGPYMLKEHVADQHVIFEANPKYWRGAANISRVIWKVIPSPAERVSLLKSGAVDMAEGLGTADLQALAGVAGVKVVQSPSENMVYVGMNNSIAPFSDLSVRQAVSYAVNYEDILSNVYHGQARRLTGPLPTGSQMSLGDSIGYKTDPSKAKSLLAGSSYKGQAVTLSINNANAEHKLIAVRVQSALQGIGINVQIEELTAAVFAERQSKKQLQMHIDEILPWIDDPDYVLSLVFQCDVFGNYTAYCNKNVDKAIAAGWTETDAAKRQAMFAQAQRDIVNDAPWAFLAQPNYKLAMRSNVTGYVHYLNEIPLYYDLNKS